jgi:hypothetical protein
MIGHFIVFLKTFFFQYKTEILLSFIFFYCIFLYQYFKFPLLILFELNALSFTS